MLAAAPRQQGQAPVSRAPSRRVDSRFRRRGPGMIFKSRFAEVTIMAWVAERVAPHKKIRAVEIVSQIPKSPTGKILRRVLIEQERARRKP